MAITVTKTEARKLLPILELEQSPEADALAVELLEKAFELYEKRAKYALVAQNYIWDGEKLRPSDQAARSAVVGLFSSHGQALNAAGQVSVAKSGASIIGQSMYWVLPFTAQSPSQWHKATKDAISDTGTTDEAVAEKLRFVAESSPPSVKRCGFWFKRGNALHICQLDERHPGRCDTPGIPESDEDQPLHERRRLVQPPIDLEGERVEFES